MSAPSRPFGRVLTATVGLLYGFAVLAAELALVRLVTPFVGASLPVWASVIALVLTSLAVGASLGGRWSRRGAVRGTLIAVLGVAGIALVLTPWLLRPVLGALLDAEGAVRPAVLLLVLPVAALPLVVGGSCSPLLVQGRTSAGSQGAGAAAGLVSASVTLGSLLGSLLPAFWLLPALGTSRTYLVSGAALLAAALALAATAPRGGLGWPWGLAGWLALSAGGGLAPLSFAPRRPDVLAEAESLHHHIVVVRRPAGHRVLLLGTGAGEASYFDPRGELFYGPWPLLAAAPLLAQDPRGAPLPRTASVRVLLLGLGGGTAARMLVEAFPRAEVLGVELDAGILRVARAHLGLRHPRIIARVGDARVALRRVAPRSQHAVVVDVYRDLYVPFHLATEEFFREVRRVLSPGGVVVLNLVPLDDRGELTGALGRTLAAVFPEVHRLEVPGGLNRLLVGGDHPLSAPALAARARQLPPEGFGRFVSSGLETLRPFDGPRAGLRFTDDRAPVERLVHAALWRRLRGR